MVRGIVWLSMMEPAGASCKVMAVDATPAPIHFKRWLTRSRGKDCTNSTVAALIAIRGITRVHKGKMCLFR